MLKGWYDFENAMELAKRLGLMNRWGDATKILEEMTEFAKENSTSPATSVP